MASSHCYSYSDFITSDKPAFHRGAAPVEGRSYKLHPVVNLSERGHHVPLFGIAQTTTERNLLRKGGHHVPLSLRSVFHELD